MCAKYNGELLYFIYDNDKLVGVSLGNADGFGQLGEGITIPTKLSDVIPGAVPILKGQKETTEIPELDASAIAGFDISEQLLQR